MMIKFSARVTKNALTSGGKTYKADFITTSGNIVLKCLCIPCFDDFRKNRSRGIYELYEAGFDPCEKCGYRPEERKEK